MGWIQRETGHGAKLKTIRIVETPKRLTMEGKMRAPYLIGNVSKSNTGFKTVKGALFGNFDGVYFGSFLWGG